MFKTFIFQVYYIIKYNIFYFYNFIKNCFFFKYISYFFLFFISILFIFYLYILFKIINIHLFLLLLLFIILTSYLSKLQNENKIEFKTKFVSNYLNQNFKNLICRILFFKCLILLIYIKSEFKYCDNLINKKIIENTNNILTIKDVELIVNISIGVLACVGTYYIAKSVYSSIKSTPSIPKISDNKFENYTQKDIDNVYMYMINKSKLSKGTLFHRIEHLLNEIINLQKSHLNILRIKYSENGELRYLLFKAYEGNVEFLKFMTEVIHNPTDRALVLQLFHEDDENLVKKYYNLVARTNRELKTQNTGFKDFFDTETKLLKDIEKNLIELKKLVKEYHDDSLIYFGLDAKENSQKFLQFLKHKDFQIIMGRSDIEKIDLIGHFKDQYFIEYTLLNKEVHFTDVFFDQATQFLKEENTIKGLNAFCRLCSEVIGLPLPFIPTEYEKIYNMVPEEKINYYIEYFFYKLKKKD